MKYAVIGTSWITRAFIDAAKYAGLGEPAAVYSRNEERGGAFADSVGTKKVYTDINKLAADSEIDAVYIASPNVLHYAQSRLMLESGKNVICEKPLAVTPAQINELVRLSRSRGLVYMEAIMFLYMPQLTQLKSAMKKIGSISSAVLDFSQLSSKYPLLIKGENPNIFNPKMCTGCLMDIGVYNVYLACELFGEPKKITSTAAFLSTGADCTGTAVFDYRDKQITLVYSKIGQSRVPGQIYGDRGTILVDSVSQLGNVKIIYNDLTEEIICTEVDRIEIMSKEARAFADFIKGENREMLLYAQDLSKMVSSCMEIIRKQNPAFEF